MESVGLEPTAVTMPWCCAPIAPRPRTGARGFEPLQITGLESVALPLCYAPKRSRVGFVLPYPTPSMQNGPVCISRPSRFVIPTSKGINRNDGLVICAGYDPNTTRSD